MTVSTRQSSPNAVMPPHKAVIIGNFEKMDSALVDGDLWYKVQVIPKVTRWVKEQNKDLWYDHKTPNNYKVLDTFDVHEKLYTMMAVRWS